MNPQFINTLLTTKNYNNMNNEKRKIHVQAFFGLLAEYGVIENFMYHFVESRREWAQEGYFIELEPKQWLLEAFTWDGTTIDTKIWVEIERRWFDKVTAMQETEKLMQDEELSATIN